MLFVVATPFGMFLAVLLDKEIKGSRFYQTALYLPVVLSLALIGFIWQLFYSRDQGLINAVLGTDVDWYGDSNVNIWAVLVAAELAARRLHHAALPGRPEGRRPDAAGGRRRSTAPARRSTFFRVVFPVMRPINIIVLVITVIESLRAFDLVWVVNKGRNGLELISALVTQNMVGEASRIGFGSALATIMLVVSLVFITIYLAHRDARGEAMATATTSRPRPGAAGRRRKRSHPDRRRVVLHVFLSSITALVWLFPIVWAVLNSFRDYAYTAVHGYVSLGGWTFNNYINAWPRADFTQHFLNSVYITVPAVLLTLFLSSCVAFVLPGSASSSTSSMLGLFTAANLLPQQALLIPLFRLFRSIPLPDVMSDSELLLRQLLGR